MSPILRAAPVFALAGGALAMPGAVSAQAGPSGPQVIAAASTARISVGSRKLEGHLIATVQVDEEGRVRDVLVIENSTESGFEPQLVKVLESARFRPAIDEAGRPVPGSVDMRVELRASTGNEPKPVPANSGPEITEQEKARIGRMKCSDFRWEWELLRAEARDNTPMEFMPRIATAMYASMRTEAGDYVDAKVWKAAAKGLREAAERCEDTPGQLFWQDTYKPIMDEAVPR
jgi:TonB family protein